MSRCSQASLLARQGWHKADIFLAVDESPETIKLENGIMRISINYFPNKFGVVQA